MPNLAATLKDEIRRLARKEIRLQMGATRRAAVQHRREIAKLKKQLLLQQRAVAALKVQSQEPPKEPSEETGIPAGSRFSARSVRAQRRRLKLTAAQYGKLIGVSAQTVYLWERGKVRPAKARFAALIKARALTRRDALRCLPQKPTKK